MNQKGTSSIHAKNIKAKNIVQGTQQIGGEPITNPIEISGSITADELIDADNIVAGFQYIADPANVTTSELQQEVTALKAQLAAAIAAGDVEQSGTVKDVQSALTAAEEELAQEEPEGNRIIRNLKTAADLLAETAKTTDAVRKAGVALGKLGMTAYTLYQIGEKLFNG